MYLYIYIGDTYSDLLGLNVLFFPSHILSYVALIYSRVQQLILQIRSSRMFKKSIYFWAFYVKHSNTYL